MDAVEALEVEDEIKARNAALYGGSPSEKSAAKLNLSFGKLQARFDELLIDPPENDGLLTTEEFMEEFGKWQ